MNIYQIIPRRFARIAVAQLALAFVCTASSASLSGLVVDEAGNAVNGLKVIIYPVQTSVGRGVQSTLVADGSNAVNATTDGAGDFSVSLPSEGQYNVCTQGAAAPLIDLCVAGPFTTVSVTSASSGQPIRLVLSKGVPLTVHIQDARGRLSPGNIDVTLTLDSFRSAPKSSQQISPASADFVFTVPPHSTGRVMIKTSMPSVPAFIDASGNSIAQGVPTVPWAADQNHAVAISAQ